MGECLTLQQNWVGIRKWYQYLKSKCLVYESGLNYEFIPIVWLYIKIARELQQDMQCFKLRGLGSI